MTCIALLRCRDMSHRLAAGVHTIVTGGAGPCGDTSVIEYREHPCCGGMATIASIGSHWMIRWFTGCNRVVVTTDASALHLCVINGCRGLPCRCVMAVLTQYSARDVRCILAGSRHAIVAIGTVVDDAGVTELCRYPRGGSVASFTGIVSGYNMSIRLAGCFRSIVAIKTVGGDAGVIKRRGRPRRSVMTQRAIQCGCNMAGGLSQCLYAVVTTGTGS